jgi:hypothetical protein
LKFVQINASVIGIEKPVPVALTQGNVRRSMAMMRGLAKAEVSAEEPQKHTAADQDDSDIDVQAMLTSFDKQLQIVDDINNYVVDMLKLTKRQQGKLDDVTIDDLSELAAHIAAAVLGFEEKEPTEEDKKSDGE